VPRLPCTITHGSGDKLYLVGKKKAGDCTYTVQFVRENRAVATTTSQWQRPQVRLLSTETDTKQGTYHEGACVSGPPPSVETPLS
jgi:hypothetical protein